MCILLVTLQPASYRLRLTDRTVNPEWNESFECVVRSRVAANMEFEIHDWDRVGSATHLGRGKIDLAAIVPFEVQEIRLPVVHDKLGEKGTLHLRLMFQPESECNERHLRPACHRYALGSRGNLD